jgi:hypothetical protein
VLVGTRALCDAHAQVKQLVEDIAKQMGSSQLLRSSVYDLASGLEQYNENHLAEQLPLVRSCDASLQQFSEHVFRCKVSGLAFCATAHSNEQLSYASSTCIRSITMYL